MTEVFSQDAQREAAFRFLENDEVKEGEIRRCVREAGAGRCSPAPFAFVAVDQTSLTITDRTRSKGLGMVGTRAFCAQGLQVMSAVAITPDGTPQGLVGQSYWTRQRTGKRKKETRKKRKVEDKETHYWLDVIEQARTALGKTAPTTRPWFQLDRAGDSWPILQLAANSNFWLTVRASWNRRLQRTDDQLQTYLWDTMEKCQPLGRYSQDVPDGDGRTARSATVEVRAHRVTLDLLTQPSERRIQADLWAVFARECRTTPAGEDPLEWMLLTNHPASTFANARLVVFGYTQRWRIEEFHRVWKTGACRVEETQLRDRDRVVRWAVILAAVAMRIVRMTYRSRHHPDCPATDEFSRPEVEAIVRLARPKGHQPRTMPTMGDVVLWLANLGGYTGKSSGGPPGAIVLARGLRRIEPLVDVLIAEGKM